MLKKLLSLSLITLFLFQAVHFNLCSSYALGGFGSDNKANQGLDVARKNKCNSYEDVDHAYQIGVRDLKGGKGHYKALNTDPNCNTDLWMWDYVQVYLAASPLLDVIKRSRETIATNEVIRKVADTIKILFGSDDEVSEKISKTWINENKFLRVKLDDEVEENTIEKTKEQAENINHLAKTRGITLGAVLGIVAPIAIAFVPGVRELAWGGYIASMLGAGITAGGIGGAAGYYGGAELEAIQDNNKKLEVIERNRIYLKCYSSAIDKILEGLKKEVWKDGDMLYLNIDRDLENYNVNANFLKTGINYSKESEKKFNSTFCNLKKELEEIVTSNYVKKEEL